VISFPSGWEAGEVTSKLLSAARRWEIDGSVFPDRTLVLSIFDKAERRKSVTTNMKITEFKGLSRRELLTQGVVMVGTVGATLFLVACSPSAPTAAPAASPVVATSVSAKAKATTTLVFNNQVGVTNQKRYDPLVATYEKEHPDVKIQMIYGGSSSAEIQQKLLLMISGGTPPDLTWDHTYLNPGLTSLGVLEDLNPLIRNDPSFKVSDFFPSTIRDFQALGKQSGLPRGTTSIVMLYNKSLFEKASIPVPTENWTWEDYVNIALKLTSGSGPNKVFGTGGWPQSAVAWNTFVRVWQEGGDVLNTNRTQYTMNEEPGVKAVQSISDLIHRYKVHATSTDLQGSDVSTAFNSGKIAMMPIITYYDSYQGAKFEWDIQHLPHGSIQVTRNASDGQALVAGGKNRDQAWEALKFFEGKIAMDHFAQLGISVAHVQAAKDYAASRGDRPPKHFQIGLDALAYARPEPVAGAWTSVHQEISSALDGVYGPGAKDPKAQLDSVASRVNALIKELPKA
jgi:multiple sugar transport system substrate-binding protein